MLRNELLIYFPQKEFYCQEDIKGYVELRNPAPMTIYEVNIQFLGCEWAEMNSKKEGNVFIKHEAILTGDGSRDRGKDFFGYKVKQTTVVPAGSHYYEFTIKLPEACPPSYQCAFGKIVYELRATAVSGIKGVQDLVSCATVPVGGSLFDLNFLGNNSVPTSIKDTKAFLLFGNVDYVINLDSKVFYSGDMIRAKADFQNKSSKVIKPLVARLVQRIELHSYGKLQKVDEIILASQVLGSLEAKQNKNYNIELQLPTTAPESVFRKDIDKKKACGKIIQIAYQIVLHGEVSMAVDLHTDIPISVIRKERQQFLMSKHGIAPQPQQVPQAPPQAFQQPQYVQPQMVPQMIPQQQQQYVYQQVPQQVPQYDPQQQVAVAPQDPNSLYPSLYPSSGAPQQNYYPVQDPMQQPQQQGVAKKVPPPAPSHLVMQQHMQQAQQQQPQYVQPQFQQPPQQQAYAPQQQQQMPPQYQGMAPQGMAPQGMTPQYQGMTAHSSAQQQSEIYDEFFTEQ